MELTNTQPPCTPVLDAQRALDNLRHWHIDLTDDNRFSTTQLMVIETLARDIADTLRDIQDAIATHIRRSTIP